MRIAYVQVAALRRVAEQHLPQVQRYGQMCRCSADAVQMQCACSAHAVLAVSLRLRSNMAKRPPHGSAWRQLMRLRTASLAALGGLTIVPLGASHCLSGSRVFARASKTAHSTGFGHPDTKTRTGSCTSATVARIRSAHVDSSDVRGCSEHALVSLILSLSLFLWAQLPKACGPVIVVY